MISILDPLNYFDTFSNCSTYILNLFYNTRNMCDTIFILSLLGALSFSPRPLSKTFFYNVYDIDLFAHAHLLCLQVTYFFYFFVYYFLFIRFALTMMFCEISDRNGLSKFMVAICASVLLTRGTFSNLHMFIM